MRAVTTMLMSGDDLVGAEFMGAEFMGTEFMGSGNSLFVRKGLVYSCLLGRLRVDKPAVGGGSVDW